jgi:hypothetical protein
VRLAQVHPMPDTCLMSRWRGLRGAPLLVVLLAAMPMLVVALALNIVSFQKYGLVSLLLAILSIAVTMSACGFVLRQTRRTAS